MIKVAGIQFTDDEVEMVKTAAEGGKFDAFKQSIKQYLGDALAHAQAWTSAHPQEAIGLGVGGAMGAGIGAAAGPHNHKFLSAMLGGASGAGLGYGYGHLLGNDSKVQAFKKALDAQKAALEEKDAALADKAQGISEDSAAVEANKDALEQYHRMQELQKRLAENRKLLEAAGGHVVLEPPRTPSVAAGTVNEIMHASPADYIDYWKNVYQKHTQGE